MDVPGAENLAVAGKQVEAGYGQISQQISHSAPGFEKQLHLPGDIASARQFFTSKLDIHSVSTPLAGLEHSSTAAMKAASQAISPMLQIIMRLPGHLGIFSSFLEVFKNLFMPHDLLSQVNLGDFAPGLHLGSGVTNLGSIGHPMPFMPADHTAALTSLPGHLQAFQTIPSDLLNRTASNAHLHLNAFDSLKQSLNVSAGIDLRNPQFEGLNNAASSASQISAPIARGDALAGPGISGEAITPKLSPAQTIFSSKSFESAQAGSLNNNLLVANNQSTTLSTASGALSTTNDTLSLNQISSTANTSNGSVPVSDNPGQISTTSPTGTGGLHAKALSLQTVMHKGFPPAQSSHNLSNTVHKHLVNNPFAKLASNTRQAFQTAQRHLTTDNIYTVRPGDNLWQISKNIFGAGEKWTEIYKLNNETIGSNPSLILSGQKLALSHTGMNSIHPVHAKTVEQLAHHVEPTVNSIHHQPVYLSAHSSAHNESTIAHAQSPQGHPNQQETVVQNKSTLAHNQSKHSDAVIANNHLPQISIQHAHGLSVEKTPDQLLSGAGGAQAANNSLTNKITGHIPSNKGKSVVSFSLTPDLAQW